MSKIIEIPFGAKDSKNMCWEYTIPEGMEAVIEDGKVIVREKESEDERIRKWLIEMVEEFRKANPTNAEHNGNCSEAIAYLEKQKEQKPRKFKVGDKVHLHGDDTNVITITGFRDDAYLTYSAYGPILFSEEDNWEIVEQQSAEWVLPEDFEEAVYKVANFISPFDNQEEFRKTSHRFAEQLLSLAKKELDKPKAEWSEEEEEKITFLERLIRYNVPEGQYSWVDGHKGGSVTKLEAIAILKSIRPQPHWKPSEEQIKALQMVKDSHCFMYQKDRVAIEKLLEQIKFL